MNEKKTEPTDAMVDEAANAVSMEEMDTPLHLRSDLARQNLRNRARTALSSALNHPDAARLFAFEFVDALRAAREQGWDQAVDWIKRDQGGPSGRTTNARNANPHRTIPGLPAEDGAVIVPADGREFIEAEVAGQTFIAREAVVCESDFGPANVLEGAWRRADTGARVGGQVSRDFITPGTWKLEGE